MTDLQITVGIAFLLVMMFAMGCEAELPEMISQVRKYRLAVSALLANLVLVPLLGIAVVALFHLKGDYADALLILAVAFGAPFSANFTSKATGAINVAASLLFVLLLTSVVFTPLAANLLLPGTAAVSLHYARAIAAIALVLVLPFALGQVFKKNTGHLATLVSRAATVLALVIFVSFMVLSAAAGKQARTAIGGETVLAILAFAAGAMLIGWLAGGPERPDRQVMAIGTGMRNVAVASALVRSLGSQAGQQVIVAFFSVVVPLSLLLTIAETVRSKRRALSAEPSGQMAGEP